MPNKRFRLSTTDLATLLGLSKRRVQQMATEGIIPRCVDDDTGQVIEGVWDAAACVQAYIASKLDAAKPDDQLDRDLKLAKLRRTNADADLREGLRDREKAKLLDASDVMSVLADSFSQIRTRILALPSRLTLQVLGKKDAVEVNGVITEEVRLALTALKEYQPSDFRSPDLPALAAQQDDREAADEEPASTDASA